MDRGKKLCYAVNWADAMNKAEELRHKIEECRFERCDLPCGCVTVSVGLCVKACGESAVLDDFVGEADRALYQAKQQGRNRVAIAS